MKKILFQGDSITDAGRSKECDTHRGSGYAQLVTASLGLERPNEFEFVNRGISGNRVIDLLARVKSDLINLKPDYLSILIGINDVWHEINYQNGLDTPKYELYYNLLIKEVREALPNIKIMMFEPFVLKGSGTEEAWEDFRKGAEGKAKAARKVAEDNNILFIPLMKKFDELTKLAPNEYWLVDGVHPTPMGHEVIKNEWLKAFKILENR